ncbi:MAG: hypothetical protein M5U14_09645 [Acidimicrobiia bacterium]|nr:hypothetical protein [Acidimicrobiia bacterium]
MDEPWGIDGIEEICEWAGMSPDEYRWIAELAALDAAEWFGLPVGDPDGRPGS